MNDVRWAALAGAMVLSLAGVISCDEPTRAFLGRFYLEPRDCLGTVSSIDVVEGEPAGSCPPTCLVQRVTDGTRPVYVTTECAPFPPDSDATGLDPRCAQALDAFGRNDTCLPDGGSSKPRAREETDAGVRDPS